MQSESLNTEEWKEYFSGISKKISAESLVEIEVQALGTTDEIEAEWIKLKGIIYDQKDDELSVYCEQLDHIISRPREISVNKGPEGIMSYEVNAEGGYRHIIRFKVPLRS